MILARPRLRALVATALAVLVMLVVAPLRPAAAQGNGAPLVSVEITAISDPVLDLADPEQVVRLGGRITNTSDVAIRYLNVHFWRSLDPITTETALDAALVSEPQDPLGSRLTDESNLHTITREERILPGRSVEFNVRATVGDLALPVDDAVYLLGVHVRGIPDEGNGTATLGRARILAVATKQPLQASAVVTLTAQPTQTSSGDFVDDSLATDLGGRLAVLLDLAERPGATVVIDPSLLAEAEAMAQPHTVAGVETPGLPAAAEWARRVRALAGSPESYRFWFADPDLVRAIEAGTLEELTAWNADLELPPDLAALPVVTDVADQGTPELAGELTRLGVQRLFASNVIGASANGLVGTSGLTPDGMAPDPVGSQIQSRAARMASEFLADVPPAYLIEDAADAELVTSPGYDLQLVGLPRSTGDIVVGPVGPAPQPWTELADRLRGLVAESDFLLDLTGEDFRPAAERIAVQASSSQFDTQESALEFVAAQGLADVDPDRVSIIAAKQFVMSARTSTFPITINNPLPVPVTVRLVFESAAPQRIDVPPSDLVTVGRNENLTLNVSPEATANGIVRVDAMLQSRDGTDFGKPMPIEITATDLGRVGWIIILVSGAVVLAGTFMRIRAVQRGQAGKGNSGEGQ